MQRRLSVSRVTLALLLGFGLAGSACKSGEGERCQLTSDCSDNLVCAPSTNTCVEPVSNIDGGGGIDAAIDASLVDAPGAIDAPLAIDAPAAVDAAIDAP